MDIILHIAEDIKLPLEDKEEIQEYLEYNEFGIAFEILCIAIEEYDIGISQERKEEIARIGNEMEMDERLWSSLKISANDVFGECGG